MMMNIKKFIEEIDKTTNFVVTCKELAETTNKYFSAELEKVKLKNKNEKYPFSGYREHNYLVDRYQDERTRLSKEIKNYIERITGSKISHVIFSEIMKYYNLHYYLTEEISKKVSKERERFDHLSDYDNLNKKTINELKVLISSLESTAIFQSQKRNHLTNAKKVLDNKIQQNIINLTKTEFQEFRKRCLLKTSHELRDILFDDNSDVTDDEEKIIRHILKDRHEAENKSNKAINYGLA